MKNKEYKIVEIREEEVKCILQKRRNTVRRDLKSFKLKS